MKKFTFGALTCLAACTLAFAGCAKNDDCGSECGDKAAVKSIEGTAQPASAEGKKSCCDKSKQTSCTAGAEGTAQAASAETKKSCTGASTCQSKTQN